MVNGDSYKELGYHINVKKLPRWRETTEASALFTLNIEVDGTILRLSYLQDSDRWLKLKT